MKKKPTPALTQPGTTFIEYFNTGKLDTTKWAVSNGSAPQGGGPSNVGVFSPANIDMSQGMLGLKLTQSGTVGTSVTSTGAEIHTINSFGYGIYEWVCRASSTAVVPTASTGSAISGSVTGLFNYYSASTTEIDIEVCGTGVGGVSNTKNDVFLGTWTSEDWANDHTSTSVAVSSPEASFFYYKFIWTAGQVLFYVNDVLKATITTDVPSHVAPAFINHWGTDFTGGWGGVATPGTVRWMWVSMFKFTPS